MSKLRDIVTAALNSAGPRSGYGLGQVAPSGPPPRPAIVTNGTVGKVPPPKPPAWAPSGSCVNPRYVNAGTWAAAHGETQAWRTDPNQGSACVCGGRDKDGTVYAERICEYDGCCGDCPPCPRGTVRVMSPYGRWKCGPCVDASQAPSGPTAADLKTCPAGYTYRAPGAPPCPAGLRPWDGNPWWRCVKCIHNPEIPFPPGPSTACLNAKWQISGYVFPPGSLSGLGQMFTEEDRPRFFQRDCECTNPIRKCPGCCGPCPDCPPGWRSRPFTAAEEMKYGSKAECVCWAPPSRVTGRAGVL